MKYGNLLFFMMTLLLSSCWDKECKDRFGPYEFDIPVSLSPTLDTFHIGDTISINSVFDNMVYERESQDSFSLNDFLFNPRCLVRKLDTIDSNFDALESFDFIEEDGYPFSISSGGTAFSEYLFENGQYSLKFKLEPLEPGLYWLSFFSGINEEPLDFDGRCRGFQTTVFATMNQGEDNNVDFLLDSPNPEMLGLWNRKDEKFHNFGGYCFYVVE